MISRRPFERHNRGRALVVGGGSPTPSSILGASLRADFNADVGYAAGTWTNQVAGGGGDVTQATGSRQPGTLAAQINGHAALDFDGTDDFLQGAAISNFITTTAWTLWIVRRIDAIATNNATPYLNATTVADQGQFWGHHLTSTGPAGIVYQFSGSNRTDTAAVVTAAYGVTRTRFNGTTIFIRETGAAESAGTASGAIGSVAGLLNIGRGGSDVQCFDGKISRIIISNAVASAGQLTDMDTYLVSQYGAIT